MSFCTRIRATPRLKFGGRVEYFSDKKQVIVPSGTPNGFQTFSVTANIDYAPVDHFLWRIESRFYRSKDAVFPSCPGNKRNSGMITMSFAMYPEWVVLRW